jgi:hypothetical protein
MSGKAIRETVGFLGVIASLVFVGFEIRQNTLASRAAAIQESIEVARQQVQMYATDADATRIEMIGREDLQALDPVEAARFRWMMVSFFWGMQGLHRQWDLGVLPDEEWQAWNTVICANLSNPGTREVWESFAMFTPGFRSVVDAC